MSARLHFSYWSDPLCIWAYVAQDKLSALLERHGAQLAIDYRQLIVFPSVAWRFEAGPWKEQGVEGRVAATHTVARKHGHSEITGEVWRRAQPASSWSPACAIKAVFTLERDGDLPGGSAAEYQWQLRRRFFHDNKNIALRAEQLTTAEQLGIPRAPLEDSLDSGAATAAVAEDQLEKDRLRIQGSPTYVFDGGRCQLYGNFTAGVLDATVGELLRGVDPGGSAC